jgi:hypothetical protein
VRVRWQVWRFDPQVSTACAMTGPTTGGCGAGCHKLVYALVFVGRSARRQVASALNLALFARGMTLHAAPIPLEGGAGAWRRHCARRQLVLKKKCRAQGLRRGIGSMGYAVMKGKQGRAGVPRNLGERNVGHPYRPRSALVGRVEKKLPRVLYRTATGKRCRCTTPIRDTTRLP